MFNIQNDLLVIANKYSKTNFKMCWINVNNNNIVDPYSHNKKY